MLLTLIIILMLIWSAVIGSLYSNFLVFYSNFSETESYNKAYYSSISALERAELVIRQRQPWYEWSWWRIWDNVWALSDIKTETGFSYLSNNSHKKSSLFWKINSTTTGAIPSPGKWDVDRMLSTWDSSNYNKMDYENSEIILLYYDKSENNPYFSTTCPEDCKKPNLESISVKIRLPWYISGYFWLLNTNQTLTPWWGNDDPIVDRQFRWSYKEWGFEYKPFTIYATQNGPTADKSIIKESDINEQRPITFWSASWNPIYPYPPSANPTIITPMSTSTSPFDNNFQWILKYHERLKDVQLKFSLLNLLQPEMSWMIYPFLEYQIHFDPMYGTPQKIPDKYYKIETIWSFWDYQINNIIFKPTITESILRSFTTIL